MIGMCSGAYQGWAYFDVRWAARMIVVMLVLVLIGGVLVEGARADDDDDQVGDGGSMSHVRALFGDEFGQFWRDHFQLKPMLVESNTRRDRTAWMRVYRSFVPGDSIEHVLARNVSAFRRGPLRLNEDVVLSKWERSNRKQSPRARTNAKAPSQSEQWRELEMQSFSRRQPRSSTFSMDAVKSSFRDDSFELCVRREDYRSADLALLVTQLEQLFGCEADAAAFFTPQDFESPSMFWASDTFVIGFDGEQHISVYQPRVPFPYQHQEHIPDNMKHNFSSDEQEEDEVLSSDDDDDGKAEPSGGPFLEVTLREGDVLYVPRGWIVKRTIDRDFALRVDIHLHVQRFTVRDAMRYALQDIVHVFGKAEEEFMRTHDSDSSDDEDYASAGSNDGRWRSGSRSVLIQRVRASSRVRWVDLIDTAIRVTADMVPDFRLFYPRSAQLQKVAEKWREDVEPPPAKSLKQIIEHFCEAGRHDPGSLLGPVLATVKEHAEAEDTEKDGGSDSVTLLYAIEPVVSLAREIAEYNHMPSNLLQGFSIAIGEFAKGVDCDESHARLLAEHAASETRRLRLRRSDIELILQRHDQTSPWSTTLSPHDEL